MSLAAEDHLAILNLIARYNHAIDLGDPEMWADCFIEDGEFDARPVTHCHGRADLLEFCRLSQRGQGRHWTSNVLVEGEGDTATASLYLMTLQPGAVAVPGVTGVYHDQLVKQNGDWKIKHRLLVFEDPPKGF